MSRPDSFLQSLLDISEDLAPVSPPTIAGDVHLSFSGLLNPPLVLREDPKNGCGGRTWPAGTLLARFLLGKRDELRGKTIIELGAGGGLVGIALALGLHQDVRPLKRPQKPVIITDLPVLVPLQRQNIALNGLTASSIASELLSWGEPISDAIPKVYNRPDVILAADCVYFEPAFPLLLQTLKELMGIDKSGPDDHNPTCWFCLRKRRKADLRFVAMLKKSFAVREVDVTREHDEKGTLLYEIRRKE